MLDKAIRIASVAFEGKFDKRGDPYILHCIWVMNKVRYLGHDYMIVAILHDLIEDTDWTAEMLLKEGFSIDIVAGIVAITKVDGQEYDEYLIQVKFNKYAREVKKRDLRHNSKLDRLKDIRQKDFDNVIKYNKAYRYLKQG